jgi:hypothetical protein
MKFILLAWVIIFIAAALPANPVIPQIVSEMWFDESGHLMVEFCSSYYYFNSVPFSDMYIVHGGSEFSIPQAGGVGYNYPQVLDLTALVPELNLDPLSDTLWVQFDYQDGWGGYSYISWGDDFGYSAQAPQPGESLVLCHTFFGYTPVKDNPPTPGTNPFQALARDTLRVVVTDQSGNPLPDVPVYCSNPGNGFPPYTNYTDANGVFADTVYAGKTFIRVTHPQSNVPVSEQYYWLEPNAATVIPITIYTTAPADEVLPVARPGLKAYPVPFNKQTAEAITFRYEGVIKLQKGSYIRLYDMKGRFVTQIGMSAKGEAHWQPDTGISSGTYFARLISGNRIMDTATLTVTK